MSSIVILDSNKDDLNEIIGLQTMLFAATPATLESTKKTILSSKFLFSKYSMRRLLDSIKTAFDSRPLTSDCYISIISALSGEIKRFFDSKSLFNSIFQNNFIRLKLFEFGLIDISTIIEASKENESIFIYFAPEIKNANENYFNQQVKCNLSIQEGLPQDFKVHLQNREKGINEDPIAVAIRSDNLKDLQDLIKDDYDGSIPPSIYERCEFLRFSHPSYIQFAAFLGASKVFSFLIDNDAQISPTLAQFASAGGNMEIIQTLDDKGVSFNRCLEIAIEFHQKTVCEYLHRRNAYTTESVKASIRSYNMEYLFITLPFLQDINEAKDQLERTILHVAALYARFDIVKLLCQISDINVNAPDITGRTPIQLADQDSAEDIITFLESKGCSV